MRYPFFAVMVMTAVLAGRAHAQGNSEVDPANKDPYRLMLEREENERRENEKAYNAQMKRLKAQGPSQTSSDPWKKVRPADNSGSKR